jgi:hypothetical protein
MVGAFGLLDDRHHTRFPPDRLIENRARLDVFWLNRIGAFTEGTITELRWGKKPLPARQTDPRYFGERESRADNVGCAGTAVVRLSWLRSAPAAPLS